MLSAADQRRGTPGKLAQPPTGHTVATAKATAADTTTQHAAAVRRSRRAAAAQLRQARAALAFKAALRAASLAGLSPAAAKTTSVSTQTDGPDA